MVITLTDETIESLTFDASPTRTDGLHVSTIIKSICQEIDPKRFSTKGDLPWNRFETGFTFERVLELAFASRLPHIFRPGEIELDGILMSPDGIDPDGFVLEEYKCTWMYSNDAPDSTKFWHWFVQMKAYCHALGTLRARLRVLFVNGWGNKEPEYKVWNIAFTDAELQDNWNMILKHARGKGWLK